MANRDEAKIKFSADTAELNDAIKSANTHMAEYRSELKLVDAQMETAGDKTELLAEKKEILSKQLETASEKTEALRGKVEAATQIYGENSDEVSKLQTQLNNAEAAEEKIAQQINAVNGEMEQQKASAAESESALGQLTQTINAQEQELAALKQEYMNAVLQFGETSDEAQALGAQIESVSGDLAQNKEDFQNAQDAANGYDQSMESVSDSIDLVASAFAAAGLTKILTEITDTAINLANEYSNSSAIIVEGTGATGEALDGLTDSLYDAYYAVTDSEATLESVGAILAEVNTRLGLTGDELTDTTVLFSEFAEHAGVDAVDAVDSVVDVMKKWGIENEGMEGLMDRLTVANQSCSLSMDEITGYLTTNKAQFDALGYSVDESIAFLVSLADSGVNVSSVMTGMRSAISKLSETNEDVGAAFESLVSGIGNCETASEALQMQVGDTGYTVEDVFGTRAAQEMVNAIQSGNFAIEDWIEVLNNADGALASTAEAGNTLEDQWSQATRNISGAFSQVLSPAIESVSSFFAGLALKIGQLLQDFPALTGVITAVVAGLAALAGALAIATLIKTVTTAFAGLSATLLANPIALVAAAIAALVAGIVLLYNKCEWFRNAVNAVWEAIKSAVNALWSAVKPIVEAIGNAFVSAWEKIKSAWSAVAPFFNAIWETIKVGVNAVVNVLKSAFQLAWTAIKAVWDVVGGYFKAVWDTIAGIFSVVKAVLSGDFSAAWDAIKGIVSTWANYFSSVWNAIKNIFGGVGTFFKSTFSAAWEAVKGVFSTWGSFFSGLWNTISSTFSAIGTKIADAIGGAVKSGINGVISAIEGIVNRGIGLINGAIRLINMIPGVSIGGLNDLSLPRLASGHVARSPLVAEIGEYAGARMNPEIVTPQNIMRETFEDVLGSFLNAGSLFDLGSLIDAISDLASRPIELIINGQRFATATAPDNDSVSGSRLNLKTRGVALP